MQLTATSVTSAALAVPVPFTTTHVWFGCAGCDCTWTLNALPTFTLVANTNEPLAGTLRESVPLSVSTSPEPESPDTVPPTVTGAGGVLLPPHEARPIAVSAKAETIPKRRICIRAPFSVFASFGEPNSVCAELSLE